MADVLTATPPAGAPVQASLPDPDQQHGIPKVRIGMRAKMLVTFTLVFTVIFVMIGFVVVNKVAGIAQAQLVDELHNTTVSAAKTIDALGMLELRQQIPGEIKAPFPKNFPVGGTAKNADGKVVPAGEKNDLYVKLCQELLNITKIIPNASPYTYFKDPTTGELKWETTAWAFPPLDWAAVYGQPASIIVGKDTGPASTYRLMANGLRGTIDQAPYPDHGGAFNWISTYTPIKDANGAVVAGLGVDIDTKYVNTARSKAMRSVFPWLIGSYLFLIGMVLLVATLLTRPLKRLTAATSKVAEGDYDIDLESITDSKIPDEMAVLSHSFVSMVNKVRIREQKLTQQVRRLTVEIDAKKREQSVSELTDSDFFNEIVEKGKILRQRVKGHDDASSTPDGPSSN
jgi:hypothetical protein